MDGGKDFMFFSLFGECVGLSLDLLFFGKD
jgi:hypothetical protein